jgi:hypothetical protein
MISLEIGSASKIAEGKRPLRVTEVGRKRLWETRPQETILRGLAPIPVIINLVITNIKSLVSTCESGTVTPQTR